jgi:N-acetylneuraminate synthase
VCSNKNDLSELIVSSNDLANASGGKEPALEEQVTIDLLFATVCTIATIKKGEVLTKENILVKRPGTGKF